MQLAVAALVVGADHVSVRGGHLALRAIDLPERSLAEVASFSADVRSYATAHGSQWVWGRLRVYPRPEGELFPGLVVLVLAAVAIGLDGLASWRAARPVLTAGWQHILARLAAVVAVVAAAVLLAVLAIGGMSTRVADIPFRASLGGALWQTLGALAFCWRCRAGHALQHVAGCGPRRPGSPSSSSVRRCFRVVRRCGPAETSS